MLLGKRNNKPAKNFWFSPGGRIKKDEQLSQAFERIVANEVGLKNFNIEDSFLMGVWDHFYEDSAYSDEITTHYINLPHYYIFKDDLDKNLILPKGVNEQHSDWLWLPIEDVMVNSDVHNHVQVYARWILDNNVI
tara:strand:+ start:343 stop:747 length:405 start_codon:yes stop_codon:yes gene_type:complete